MKKIVKIFVLIIALTMATNGLFAQTFGIKGGLNLSNQKEKMYDTYVDNLEMKSGFHIGATVEFPISEMFSFETGLLFSTKGFKIITHSSEAIYNLMYIDIPLTAKVNYDLGGAKIFVIAGPYIGIGVGGKRKLEVKANNGENEYFDEEDIKWGNVKGESDYKRLDFGLTMGAGVELNSIQIGLTYGLGLANISLSDDYKVYNQVLGISVGFRF